MARQRNENEHRPRGVVKEEWEKEMRKLLANCERTLRETAEDRERERAEEQAFRDARRAFAEHENRSRAASIERAWEGKK